MIKSLNVSLKDAHIENKHIEFVLMEQNVAICVEGEVVMVASEEFKKALVEFSNHFTEKVL